MMQFFSLLAAFSLMAGTALTSPTQLSSRQAKGAQNVVYWGQNGGGTVENNDLGAYCTASSGIDILVLGFLYQFGNGVTVPGGTFGESCQVLAGSGTAQDCSNVAESISTCQEAGIKIILSLGGASGSYSLQSASEAEAIGQYLWDAYGNGGSSGVQRPFGGVIVNGFDFDIEINDGSSQYYQYMISTLRTNFATDPHNKYYITGAPQCPIPEPNMGVIISNSAFDYLWVQFYNNNNDFDNNTYESCALGLSGQAPFNFGQWASFVSTTPSSDALIFVGVPAAPLGANGGTSGEVYYATPQQLATVVSSVESSSQFGGIMMWSAGFSDSNVNNGCTYAQEADSILLTGSPCEGSSFTLTPTLTPVVPTPLSTSTTGTGSSTSTAPASTGTPVPEWGQVSTFPQKSPPSLPLTSPLFSCLWTFTSVLMLEPVHLTSTNLVWR
jgi:chitinase